MLVAVDPNLIVGNLAVGGLVLYALWRLIAWVRNAPVRPDPWDAETDRKLSGPEAVEVCPHCLTEQSPTAWFCVKCGRAVGPYNNLMPYVQVFSEGEVLRNGTHDRLRKSPLIVIGYFLISFNFFVFAVSVTRNSLVMGLVMLLSIASFWLSVYRNFNRPDPEPTEVQK